MAGGGHYPCLWLFAARYPQAVFDRFDYTDEQKAEELDWFGNLIRMMNEEGKREYGHLDINRVLLKDVIDLHGMLLQSSKFPIYNAEYYKVLPYIVELRTRATRM